MKKNLLWFFGLAIVAATTFTLGSCDDDPCKDVNCNNGGCVEGACVCDQGYEGTNCDVTWGNKLAGNWDATDVCTDQAGGVLTTPYTATIAEVSPTSIKVTNFGGFDLAANVTFELTTATEVKMDGTDNGGRVFTGTGTYDGTKLTYTYKVTYTDGTFENCTGTMTKK